MPTPFKLRIATILSLTASAIGLTLPLSALADNTPQSLSAKVDGKVFESDDDGIMYLIPTKGVLNLIASTKGASAYPPPKTPIDQLSINCSSFEGKPRKYTFANSGSRICDISFTKGVSQKPFGDPVAEYRLVGDKGQLEITSVKGKVIEGTFNFELVEVKTKAKMSITGGTFKAEDRQL